MAPLVFHKREIGMGVPDMEHAPLSAGLRADRADRDVPQGAIQSTNSANERGRQSRAGSLAEVVVNVITGGLLALLAQLVVLPLFGIQIGPAAHAAIAVVLTLVALLLSNLLRGVFKHIARGSR